MLDKNARSTTSNLTWPLQVHQQSRIGHGSWICNLKKEKQKDNRIKIYEFKVHRLRHYNSLMVLAIFVHNWMLLRPKWRYWKREVVAVVSSSWRAIWPILIAFFNSLFQVCHDWSVAKLSLALFRHVSTFTFTLLVPCEIHPHCYLIIVTIVDFIVSTISSYSAHFPISFPIHGLALHNYVESVWLNSYRFDNKSKTTTYC